MKLTAYNNKGRLTFFGLPMWAETAMLTSVGSLFVFLALFLPGCAEEAQQSSAPPAPPQSKYRLVQIYGANEWGPLYGTYFTDDVKYDGPWVRFYDKERRQWTKLSGTVFVEGGEN